MIPFEKYYDRGGRVAVLYSPDYGSGWSTWHRDHPGMVFDKDIVAAVLDGNSILAGEIAKKKYGGADGYDVYIGSNVETLEVFWLTPGTVFIISEYDGSESVTVLSEIEGIVA